MQSAAIHYVQPVSFYSFLCVFIFHLFSNISKTVFGSSYIWFCREFQALSFDEKESFNHRDNRGEILKILTAQFFMRHPLYINQNIKVGVQLTIANNFSSILFFSVSNIH
jgi:hypothetical protein